MIYYEPTPLKNGDGVGILVASSPVDANHLQAGHVALATLNLQAIDEPDPIFGNHYISKSPQHRTANLIAMLKDERVAAIWLARGGYGANLMLETLFQLEKPLQIKPVLGSSDGCFLLWFLMEQWGIPVFLAPMICASMTDPHGWDAPSLRWALFNEGKPPIVNGRSWQDCAISARISGGCLSMLTTLINTPFMPSLDGCLLIVEDINERPFRLERMMWQLINSGTLRGVKAILFGQFPNCFKNEAEKDHFYGRMAELLSGLGIPFAFDFPIGHAQKIVTVPLGVMARLEASAKRAVLSFPNRPIK